MPNVFLKVACTSLALIVCLISISFTYLTDTLANTAEGNIHDVVSLVFVESSHLQLSSQTHQRNHSCPLYHHHLLPPFLLFDCQPW